MADPFARSIAAFEAPLIPHPETGMPIGSYEGPVDMDRAPTGEPYIELVSDGILEAGNPVPTWFANRTFALELWDEAARDYAKGRGRHLYWREKPRWVEAEFTPVDPVAALNDHVLRRCTRIKVGFVYSRLLVSNIDPDGKEDVTDAG